jgi:hypothetical protein
VQPKRSKIHFQGSAYFAQPPAYAPFLKPIVLLKKGFSALYNVLLQVMWSELIEGKQTNSTMAALLFLLLCVCSLVFYHFGAFRQPITIAFLLIWTIDRQIALHQFRMATSRSIIRLHGSGDWLVWDQQLPDGEHNHLKLKQAEIEQITMSRTEIDGGVFDDRLALVWQVNLRLCDATEIVVDEQLQASRALSVAQPLAAQLHVPLTFKQSEGQGKYAWEPLDERVMQSRSPAGAIEAEPFPKTIQVQKTAHQWQISSRWRWISGWLLFKQVVQKTGFLLFVLWMSNFMVYWGAFLHSLLIAPEAGNSLIDRLSLLMPQWEWAIGLELGVTLLVLLIQGATLSFEEHLLLNRSHLTFYRNTKPLAQVPLEAIEATLFVKQPEPVLLIVTNDSRDPGTGDCPKREAISHQVIEIDGLQREIEFRAMLLMLNQGRFALKAGA